MSVPFAAFGPGILICTRTDLATPVAINVGFAQELTIDFSGTTKQLYGQKQFPLVAARGTIKATGKWKAAVISGIAWNNVFYGNTFASGGIAWNVDSTFTSSTTAPFTVQVGSSLTFESDLGVKYGSTTSTTVGVPNFPLQRVATGSESTGTYSVASTQPGLYTFGGGTTTLATPLKITFTNTTATGQSLIATNQTIGFTPSFQLDYFTQLAQPTNKQFAVRIYSCVGAKHSMAFKLEDFMMPEFDFDIFANASDQVIDYVFPEVS
jgi:hypothetical protein